MYRFSGLLAIRFNRNKNKNMIEKFSNIFNLSFSSYQEALIVTRVTNVLAACALTYYLVINIGNLGLQLTYITLAVLFFFKRLAVSASHDMTTRTAGALSQVFVALLVTINEEDEDIVQRAVDKYNDALIKAGSDPLEFRFESLDEDSEFSDIEIPLTPEQWEALKEKHGYELPDDSEEE